MHIAGAQSPAHNRQRTIGSMDIALLGSAPLRAGALRALYAFPDTPTLRMNFVATIDGAATGSDDRSGSINNAADKCVYDLNRALADVVLVGERTARLEGYLPGGPGEPPIVAVSRSGRIPAGWRSAPDPASGGAVLVTCGGAGQGRLDAARRLLGEEHVWVIGRDTVDLAGLKSDLAERGWGRILCEGGPTLFAALLEAGLVDELALSWVPRLIAGDGPRITAGQLTDAHLSRRHLLDIDGTLLGLWSVVSSPAS